MEYIQIPLPDFSFSEFAKEKAEEICRYELGLNDSYVMLLSINNPDAQNRFDEYLDELATNGDKIIYLSVILTHLSVTLNKAKSTTSEEQYKYLIQTVNKVKYFFYKQAASIGYNFDINAFSDNEISDLSEKIDRILEKLNEIQLGEEILFNEMDELKNDYQSLKSDYPLGKKKWYQRFLGISVSYAGEKGADAILEKLKPLLYDFFVNNIPHIISKL